MRTVHPVILGHLMANRVVTSPLAAMLSFATEEIALRYASIWPIPTDRYSHLFQHE